MPRGLHPCPQCGTLIGNAARRCRHCGVGVTSRHRGGYRRVFAPDHPMAASDGYALEHRWQLYEMAIDVPPDVHVHHRNGVKDDNRWSNLELLSASDHHKLHVAQAGVVTNQYGTFPVLATDEERRQRNIARLRLRRAGGAA